MLRDHLRISLRHLLRQKGYTIVSVGGLAVGMAACLLIGLYASDQLSFDRFNVHADRIYRLVDHLSAEDMDRRFAAVSAPMGPALADEYPEVEAAVRLSVWDGPWVRYQDRRFREGRLLFADAAFFNVFSFRLLEGDAGTALEQPNSVVLTRSLARKYFGDADPVGETVALGTGVAYTVTGVVEDPPHNSHFGFDLLASFSSLPESSVSSWLKHDFYTYLLLRDGQSAAALSAQLTDFVDRHMHTVLDQEGLTLEASLQPLEDIHLHSHRYEEIQPNGSAQALYVLGVIGLFVLVIAAANFINMSIARAGARSREVGVRKVLGAAQRQLTGQFLAEATLAALSAWGVAVLVVALTLPAFNAAFGTSLRFASLFDARVLVVTVGAALGVGLAAGIYPALVMSSFRPLAALQGRSSHARTGTPLLRNGLLVLQFAMSAALLCGTGVVVDQIHFLLNEDLGFGAEEVAVVPLQNASDVAYASMRQEWLASPDVVSVSRSSGIPGMDVGIGGDTVRPDGSTQDANVRMMWVDFGAAEAFGMHLLAGRDLSEEHAGDGDRAFLINETAARELGLGTPQQAIGKRLVWRDLKQGTVVGVVSDFHVTSLRNRIEPMVMHVWPQWTNFAVLRLAADATAAGRIGDTIAYVRDHWRAHAGDAPFELSFADDQFAKMYGAEERLERLLAGFAGLALLLSCAGLFALAAFETQRRTREMGIRKVLGASVTGLVALFVRRSVWIAAAGFVLAVPLTWLGLQRWLQGYAYHVPMPVQTFILAGFVLLLVAALAVGYHAAKAATTDPATTLRHE